MAGAPGAARKRPTRPLSWRALWPALPRTPPTGGCIIRRAPYRHDGRRRWAPGRCHAARVPAKTTHPTVRLWGGESPRGAVEGARTAVVQAAPLPSPDEDSRHPWEWLRVCWLSDATARHERGAHGDGAWRSAGGVTYLRSGRLSHRVWRGVHPGHGPCVCGRRRCLGGGGGAGPGQRQPSWRCAVPVWQLGRFSKKDPPTFQVYLSWQAVYTVQ